MIYAVLMEYPSDVPNRLHKARAIALPELIFWQHQGGSHSQYSIFGPQRLGGTEWGGAPDVAKGGFRVDAGLNAYLGRGVRLASNQGA